MKKLSIVLSIILISSIGFSQRFAVKSGHITYKLTGNTTGTKEIWWDNYGEKSCTEVNAVTVTRMMGFTSEEKEHKVSVTIEDKEWVANLLDNTGIKAVNPYYNDGKELAESMTEAQKKQLEKQVMDALNGQELGTETVLGRSCKIYSVMGSKSWIYKGVILRSEASIMGISNQEEAISFQENVRVPLTKFRPVEGIEYEDLQAQQQAYYGGSDDGYDDEEEDEQVIPVTYPFDKFARIINGFNFDGYSKTMVQPVEGRHMAMFQKNMVNTLMIVASSDKEVDEKDKDGYEQFSRNGHNCLYGNLEDGEGTALMIEYPEYDMIIIIAGMPHLSKSKLVEAGDQLKF